MEKPIQLEGILVRLPSTEQGTPGLLQLPGFQCKVLELPWKDNQKQVSCIPVGRYLCRLITSPHFGKVYQILNVPNRGNILQHNGNFAGTHPPYLTNSEGCQMIGRSFGRIRGQLAVLNSVTTLRELLTYLNGRPYYLTIKNSVEGVS